MVENTYVCVDNSHIPYDIVYDILKRIPTAKSLLRFTCISKSFSSIISQPSFIEAHQKGSLDHLIVSLTDFFTIRRTFVSKKLAYSNKRLPNCSLFQYLNKPCFQELLFMQSINGLVCLWNNHEDVAICNPFTRQHVFLPKPTTKKDQVVCCILGFDPTTNKHKVLKVNMSSQGGTQYWNIFTLGVDKSWREIRHNARLYPISNNCICIDGVIYCINFYDTGALDPHVATFNVGKENFRMIAYPHGVKNSYSPTLMEIKGQVAFLDHKICTHDGKVHMYVLMKGETDDRTTWAKKQAIELPCATLDDYGFRATHKGEIMLVPYVKKKLSYSNWESQCLVFFLYDAGKNEWTKFELYGLGRGIKREESYMVWHNLVESLRSLE